MDGGAPTFANYGEEVPYDSSDEDDEVYGNVNSGAGGGSAAPHYHGSHHHGYDDDEDDEDDDDDEEEDYHSSPHGTGNHQYQYTSNNGTHGLGDQMNMVNDILSNVMHSLGPLTNSNQGMPGSDGIMNMVQQMS